jgi:hypothetical protein
LHLREWRGSAWRAVSDRSGLADLTVHEAVTGGADASFDGGCAKKADGRWRLSG